MKERESDITNLRTESLKMRNEHLSYDFNEREYNIRMIKESQNEIRKKKKL